MVWSHKRKIIFIHVPKTGGTSIERTLNLMNGRNGYGVIKHAAFQHFCWNEFKELLGEDIYNKYFKFSIVRNPYQRIISEYFWCDIPGIGFKSNQSMDDFLNYAEEIVSKQNWYETIYHDHFIPQTTYLFDNNDNLMIDKLFRFEKYQEVCDFLKKKFNTDVVH